MADLKENSIPWHLVQQGQFIVANLDYSSGLSVGQSEVRDAYQDWIGQSRDEYLWKAIGELYVTVSRLGATLDAKKRMYYGVGLRS